MEVKERQVKHSSSQAIVQERQLLDAARTLRSWAEDSHRGAIHDVKIRADYTRSQVDPTWLMNIGYKPVKPGGRQNLHYFCKRWHFARTQIYHAVYTCGTSLMIITPGEPQPLRKFDMSLASDVLSSAFRNIPTWNPKLVSIERSRVETGSLLAWFNQENIKELKIYRHDDYSLRVEITYLHPALSPFTESLLFGWCGQGSDDVQPGLKIR